MYNKIEVYGGADINYINIQSRILSNKEVNENIERGVYLPSWQSDTVLLSTFQDTIDSTSIDIEAGSIVGYKILRKDVLKNTMSKVAETEETAISDYNVRSSKTYVYYIFPIIDDNGVRTLASPIVTSSIPISWTNCTIVGLAETDNENEYKVDSDNIWKFQLNTQYNDFTLNMDKSFVEGFGTYPKRVQGQRKYISGGLNSLCGTITCAGDGDEIQYGIDSLEKWHTFCASPCLKLYVDTQGMIMPIDIKDERSQYFDSNMQKSPIYTEFSYVQLGDANSISVYGSEVV